MDRRLAELFLDQARSIQQSLNVLDRALDTAELQVGDFQFLDRSVRVIGREAVTLVAHLEQMLADTSRTTA